MQGASPDDLSAAADVVRRYFSLLNGPTTLDTADALAALMTPGCGCRRVVRSMSDLAARGEHYFGSNRLIAAIPNRDSSTLVDVVVDYDYSDSGIENRTGRVLNVEHGRRGVKVDVRLTKSAARWLITRIDILSEGR